VTAEEDGSAPQPSADYGYGFAPPGLDPSQTTPADASATVSQDEAFSRALNAMYWGGYWTAVYHCHRNFGPAAASSQAAAPQVPAATSSVTIKEEEALVEALVEEDEDMEEIDEEASSDNGGFVSTQR